MGEGGEKGEEGRGEERKQTFAVFLQNKGGLVDIQYLT